MISGYHKIIQLFGGHHGFQPQKCINLVVSIIPEKLTAKYPKMMGPWVQGGTGFKYMASVGIYV